MRLKKELGQHFLNDEAIAMDIVDAMAENGNRQIPLLEVGPGAGAITKYLLKEGYMKYRLVEIDEEKVSFLQNNFDIAEKMMIHADFLQLDCPFQEEFQIIGNFPYNISSQIMFKVLDWKEQVRTVIGMFQKEVAQRIAAKEGNKQYGILSVLIQAFYDVEYLMDVPPQAFTPPPKVMSGVICLQSNQNKYKIQNFKSFLRLVKTAFAMRRKTLRNNWKSVLTHQNWEDSFFDKRAEQLSVADFVDFYKTIYES